MTYGVRLPAGTISAVLRDSAASAVDQRVELGQLLDMSTVSRLTDAVGCSRDKRGAVLDAAAQLLRDAQVDRSTTRACSRLADASAREVPVAEIARRFGWSPRRLHRFSVENFGVSAVTLRQLLRFRRARRLLARGMTPAEAATLAGYSDQAHLTRETVRFAGATPSRLHTPQA
jgi:AraC-like DNA-binding protein